jgi:release factor glutamine methyltransferase
MLHNYQSYTSLLQIGSSLLAPSDSAQLDAQIILSKVTNFKKEYIIAHQSERVNNNICEKYYYLIGKRRRKMPLAYVVGDKEFYGITFKVNSGVLIPRPETEGIIDLALEFINHGQNQRVIDLGTGSGCIAITLAKLSPKIDIDAVDSSEQALIVARINAKKILGKHNIRFKRLNYLNSNISRKYDLILSNPPYIPYKNKNKLAKELSFEPALALFAKTKGLQFYIAINKILKKNLNPKGMAILEIGEQKAEDLYKIFGSTFKFEIKADLSSQNRYLIISPLS